MIAIIGDLSEQFSDTSLSPIFADLEDVSDTGGCEKGKNTMVNKWPKTSDLVIVPSISETTI